MRTLCSAVRIFAIDCKLSYSAKIQSSASISACDASQPICTPDVPLKAIAILPIALCSQFTTSSFVFINFGIFTVIFRRRSIILRCCAFARIPVFFLRLTVILIAGLSSFSLSFRFSVFLRIICFGFFR